MFKPLQRLKFDRLVVVMIITTLILSQMIEETSSSEVKVEKRTKRSNGVFTGVEGENEQLTVAIVTLPYSGHLIPLTPLVEELLKRQHKVIYCILDVGYERVVNSLSGLPNADTHLEILNLQGNNTLMHELEHQDASKLGGSPYKMFTAAWYKFAAIEREMLPGLIHRFAQNNSSSSSSSAPPPDVVISDFLTWAGVSAADYVDIPVITFCPGTFMPFEAPLWMPPFGFGIEKEEMRSMSKRLIALLSKLVTGGIYWFSLSLTNENRRLFGIPDIQMLNSERINIVNSVIGFDYPQLLGSSSVRYVADVRSYENEEPLSEEMREWIESSDGDDRPIVYVSMGTVATQTPETLLLLRNTFQSKRNFRFIWVIRKVVIEANQEILNDHTLRPIENLKVVTWAPQVAILRHPKVKLFFSHGGANSLTESMAHGVPVICMPFLGDQPDNCVKAKQAGFSRTLLLAELLAKPQLLSELLEEMVENSTIHFHAKRMQKLLLKEKKYGLERAIDLVEEVALFGEDMFLPFGTFLPWYQRYSVDVMVVLSITFLVFSFITVLLCRCICCCNKSSKLKKD